MAALGVALTALVAGGVDNGVDSASGWRDLAVVVLGTLTSVGLGVVVWLSLLVAAARRLFPRGARLAPLLQSVGGVLGVVVLVAALQGVAGGATAVPVVLLAALAVTVVPPVVFVLRGRTAPRPGPPAEWPLPPG